MSFQDKTDSAQTDAITFEVDLPHSAEKVWRTLTEPELMAQWLLPANDFSLAAGHAFTLQAPPLPQWDGKVQCRVLEVENKKLLRYGWVVGDGMLDTTVTFTLEAVGAGTRLTIVQSGFKPSQEQNFAGARYGWRLMGQKLVDLIATLSPSS